ncbi:hypothetical protein M0R19_05495 [Candidatus Pacearchaeota archaeon]|jgi:hypothetical protein|nr:hypothetical protein [Candidatus Pacearchaeota archaeon]
MTKKNPKALGNSWEREFAKKLSLWWTSNEDKNVFWRTDSSGARGTVHSDLQSQKGDISYNKEIGRPLIENFVFELKRYTGIDLFCLIKGTDKQVWGWWEKLVEESIIIESVILSQRNTLEYESDKEPSYFLSGESSISGGGDRIPFLIIKIVNRGVVGFLPVGWSGVLNENKIDHFKFKNACIFAINKFMNSQEVLEYVRGICK